MHYWVIAIIAAIGAIGGLVNVFLGDTGVSLPKTDPVTNVWRPGFLGVMGIGALAAVGSWAMLNASELIGSSATPLRLVSGEIASALVIGFGGTKWFKSESDKRALKRAASIAAGKASDKSKGAAILSATPNEALKLAIGMPA